MSSGASPGLGRGSLREYQREGGVKIGDPGNRGFPGHSFGYRTPLYAAPLLPSAVLRLGPRAWLGQTLESSQACLGAAQDGRLLFREEGKKKSFIVCAPLCARERRLGGRAVSHCPLAVPPASHRAGYRGATVLPDQWACDPPAGVAGAASVALTSGGGPLGQLQGSPQLFAPTPNPTLQSGFSVSHLGPRGPIRRLYFLFGELTMGSSGPQKC